MQHIGTFKIKVNTLKALVRICDIKDTSDIVKHLHVSLTPTHTIISGTCRTWFARVKQNTESFEGDGCYETCIKAVELKEYLKKLPKVMERYDVDVTVSVFDDLGVTRILLACADITTEIYDLKRDFNKVYHRITPMSFSGETSYVSIEVQGEIKKFIDTVNKAVVLKRPDAEWKALIHTHNGKNMVKVEVHAKDVLICALPLDMTNATIYASEEIPNWAL